VTWSTDQSQGQYGDLTVDANTGQWHYHLNNHSAQTNALAEGEHHTEQFVISAIDSLGRKVNTVISVEVDGSNDLPTISGLHNASLNEMGNIDTVAGKLVATDPDHGDSVSWAVPQTLGQYGHLTIDQNSGVWIYQLDNNSPNTLALHAGEVATETFRVTATDSSGLPVSQIVTIAIHGTDEIAKINGVSSASLTEDKDVVSGQLHIDGQLNIIDPDAGQNQFQASALQGQFGTLSIDSNGHWTYTADNAQAVIQGLKSGESLTEILYVHSVDGTEQQVTVTINGTDDKAVIGGAATANVTEDKDVHRGLLRVDGALTVTDADSGQAQFQATSLQGQFGTLSIDSNGHWTYTADNSQTVIQGLKSGESLTDTLLVHSVDGTSQKVTITINGNDDKAVIGGAATASVTEDKDVHSGQLRVDGALSVTDTDLGQSQFSATSLQGQFGSLSINSNGHWTYTADNSQTTIQGLKSGESLTDTLIVHSVDGSEQKVMVTINGTDDKAIIGGTATASVTEDKDVHNGVLRVDGALTVSDADNNQAQFVATSMQGQYGDLSIDNNGHWSYTTNNATPQIQRLKSGDTVTDTLLVHSVDGSEQKVTIIINGTNDKAVIAGTVSASMTEDKDVHQGLLRVDGTLTVTDVDSGQNQFQASALQGQFGSLSLNELGHWTYTANNSQPAIQGLKTGESLTDTLIVHSVDGTEQKVTITINGTDDKAQISSINSAGTVTATLTEDKNVHQGLLRVDGALTVADVDLGQNQFQASALQGQFGTLSLNNLGHWTYTADNAQPAIQGLKSGESLTDTLLVRSVDGTEQTVTVTINGTDDKAVIGGVDTGSVTENSAGKDMSPDYAQPGMAQLGRNPLYTSGTLTISDLDTGDAAFNTHGVGFTYSGKFGDLLLQENGQWTYYADAGGVRIKGGYASNRGSTIDQLGEGQSLTDTITVYSKDGTSHDIVITIHGSNDRPYCSSEVVLQSGSEDTRQTLTTVQLLANTVDVDANDAGKLTIENLHADHGSILINGDGTFTFTPEKDYNGAVHFSYDVKDAHGGVTHTGASTNLAAVDDHTVFGGTTTDFAKEDVDPGASSYGYFGGTSYSMTQWHQLTITDTDSKVDQVDIEFGGKTVTWQVGSPLDIQTNYGKFELTTYSHGAHKGELVWLYNGDNKNPAIQGLKAGESLQESITLVAPDGTLQSLSVEIKGTEDNVIIDSPAHLSDVIEQQSTGAQVSGQLQAHDSDTHDSVSWTVTQTAGKYGAFSVGPNGQWHYVVDESKAGALGQGDEWNEHFTVEAISTDGSRITKTVTVVVHGSNDAPTVKSGLVLSQGREDTQVVLTQDDLLAYASDTDINDRGWLRVHNLTADHGTITTNADGTFTFTPEKDYNGNVHFSYDVTDRHGGITHTEATSTLTANNDNPDVSPLTDSIKEGASHNLDLLTGATDKEGDTLHIEQLSFSIDGAPSTSSIPTGLSLAADGHTLIIDATDPTYNHLANGQSLKIAVSYLVDDGQGGQSQQTADLTIQGTDDKATLVSNVIQLTENQALDSQFKTYKGNLQLVDPDTGDKTHFAQLSGTYLGQGFAPGNLDVWSDGSYQFRLEGASNRHADDIISSLHTGESMELPYEVTTSDGQTLTIMVKVIGEDNQARIEVGRYSSFNEHAYEDNLSPGSTPNQVYSGGNLHVIDPDHDQAGFIAQNLTTPEGGHFFINARGNWAYTIDNDKLQHLGAGQSYQKTFTVESIDGSAHQNITVTVHGTNDAPVVSAQVQLAAGTEDTDIQLSTAELIANATDVDDNDAGQLSIANLTADHGTITVNPNGTFTFHPDKDYNGLVHFSYDIKDAHGGVTHTGANITLASINDTATIDGQSHSSTSDNLTEDTTTSSISGHMTLIDPDTGEDKFTANSHLQGTYGHLIIDIDGNWQYQLDNTLATTNGLATGQVVTDSITVTSPDGTASHTINVQIHGHDDTPSLSVNEGGATKYLDLLGGLSSGTVSHMQFSTDGVHYTNQVPDGFMLASDGHTLQVDPAHNSYNHLANGIASKIDIKYELQQGAGSNALTTQQQAQVVVTGTSDRPIIHSFTPHSQQNSGPVSGNLLQGATDVDDGAQLVLHDVQFQDPVTHHYVTVQAGQTHNITGVGVIAISANGDYTFTPNSQFSGQVPNLIYRVTDTHGDYADNSQNNLTIHIDPYQAPIIIAPLTIALAHDTGSSATDLITQDGALSISGQTAGMQVEYSTDGGTHWSTQFTPVEGLNQLQVRQTDAAGHTSTATSLDFTLDTKTPTPYISLDPITADNVLNQAELSGNLPITGSVGSEISVGDSITLTLGTHTYTGTVDAQHRFSIDVPANQLSSHTNISASVTITDTAGNSATATDNHHYSTDTNAAIRVNPITSDNIIEASEQQQAIDITGTVSGVEDGQTVTVSIGGHHSQALVAHGAWHTSLSAAEVQALQGGTIDVTASVHDLAGNVASIHTPLYVSDGSNPVPSLSFKTPPTPTGGGSIGSHISGDLVAPPLIQQLTPNLPSGGWAISDGNGHTSTSLHGQYGTLTIDPVTGHVDYVYNQAPTPGNKAAGGTHWAGQTTSEEHHDIFQVVYHDAHASNVDVKVNLDVTYIHGHSGQNQSSTHLVEMTVTPAASTPPPSPAPDMHDTPQDDETSVVVIEELDIHDDAMAHRVDGDASPKSDIEQPPEVSNTSLPLPATNAPIDHYLQMVGLSQGDVTPPSNSQMGSDLPAVITLTDSDPHADMLDTSAHDHFDNPLSDEDTHKEEHAAIIDETIDHMDHQANDDDLLHSALNDMHNQT